jgi:hypothetical protein
MRDFKNMKRQRGRNRGGNPPGGGKPQHNVNRSFDSNGPDGVKVRGHAQSVYEKYQQLARDAFSSGDRVLAENHLQHAEHYFRVVRALQPNKPPADIVGRDTFTNGMDIDFEDESGAQAGAPPEVEAETPEAPAEGSVDGRDARDGRRDDFRRDERPRDEFRRDRDDRGEFRRDRDDRDFRRDRDRGEYGRRDERPRDDRPRDDRPRDDRPRDDRPRDDRPRDDRPRDREDRPRDDRPGEDRPRSDRPRDDRPREDGQDGRRDGRRNRDRDFDRGERRDRFERDRGEPRPEVAAEGAESAGVMVANGAPEPARAPESRDDGFALRSEDGGFSPAPAFLQSAPAAPPAEAAPEAEERRPRARRPRRPKTFEGGEAGEAGAPEAAGSPAAEEA